MLNFFDLRGLFFMGIGGGAFSEFIFFWLGVAGCIGLLCTIALFLIFSFHQIDFHFIRLIFISSV